MVCQKAGWQLEYELLQCTPAMKFKFPPRLVPLIFLAAAPLAQAHPGHGPADFANGFVHPFTGWDHLLAMVAVGLWAAQLGRCALWAMPAAFVGSMATGAAMGIAGFAPSGVEWWIMSSVFVLGLLIAGAIRIPLAAGLGIAALAGFFHGVAHGMEMPLQSDSIRFLAGMVVATVVLHSIGVATGVLVGRKRPSILRLAGAGIAAAGVVLMLA